MAHFSSLKSPIYMPRSFRGPEFSQSERFCFPDADLVLESSDNVRFKVHRTIMDRHSSGTSSISDGSLEDSVKLAESAKVLDLLLSIVYRLDRAKSNLRSADFDVLNAVAEAAEKYSIDVASGICEVYMCESGTKHPIEVMKYAIKYDHVEVMDGAAPWLIGLPENSVLHISEQAKFLRAWARYYSACSKQLGVIYANRPRHTTMYHSCNICPAEDALDKAVLEAIAIMGTDPTSFRNADEIFCRPLTTASKCSTCCEWLLGWKKKIAAGMDSVPKFSTFI